MDFKIVNRWEFGTVSIDGQYFRLFISSVGYGTDKFLCKGAIKPNRLRTTALWEVRKTKKLRMVKAVQWNLVIKRSDITKPSYNKVILLVSALYSSFDFFFHSGYNENLIQHNNFNGPKVLVITRSHCIITIKKKKKKKNNKIKNFLRRVHVS